MKNEITDRLLLTQKELESLNTLKTKFDIGYLTRNSVAITFGGKFVGEVSMKSFRECVLDFLPQEGKSKRF